MNAGSGRLSYTGAFDRIDGTQALPQLRQDSVPPGLARTVGFPAPPSSALQLQAARGSSFAAALRTFGPGGDEGSTTGGEPAAAWVVASGALGPKDDWRLVLANPASRPARVTLWLVSASGVARKLSPRVVVVGPRRSRLVGVDFTQGARLGAVVAVATGGTFVPLAASYTADGHGYSSALGVPIPARWIPNGMG
jgi:hypothetical protein